MILQKIRFKGTVSNDVEYNVKVYRKYGNSYHDNLTYIFGLIKVNGRLHVNTVDSRYLELQGTL